MRPACPRCGSYLRAGHTPTPDNPHGLCDPCLSLVASCAPYIGGAPEPAPSEVNLVELVAGLALTHDALHPGEPLHVREALKAVPKGVYEAGDAIGGTPRTREFIRIRVKVTVEEDTMTFDFTGTDPQVSDSINSNLACTKASCYYIVKALLDPGLPPNIGSYRPLRIIVPEGCVINAKAPAAVGNSTIIVTAKIVDVLLLSLIHI